MRLILGDALEFMTMLDDASVDHVVTDPPYGEKTHAGARTRVITGRKARAEYAGAVKSVTFDAIDAETFLTLCRECVRVARRWVVMTCDWRHAAAAENAGLPVVRCGVWVKPDAAPQFTGDRPGTGWEAVLMLHRAGKKRWNGGGHHAVWTCPVERGSRHPTQKPLALVQEWLCAFTDPGDLVLDPYMGSGTTGVACKRLGREFIGVESDLARYEMAQNRIAEEESRYALFRQQEFPQQLLREATP